jgi:hypothetical protein
MGWRFRKVFKILPGVRLNIGKKGISSFTFGKGWFSTNVGKKGTRHNLSIPGTGISYRTSTTPLSGSPTSFLQPANTQLEKVDWTCSNCNQRNFLKLEFCANCGTTYHIANSSAFQANALARRPWIPVATVAGLLIFVVGICSLCRAGSNNTSNQSVTAQPTPSASSTPPNATPIPTLDYRRHKNKSSKSLKSVPAPLAEPAPTSRQKTVSGGPYFLGPRGGCYYINSHGNKTYVSRSQCN